MEFNVGRAVLRRVFDDGVGKRIEGKWPQDVLWRLARPPRRRVGHQAAKGNGHARTANGATVEPTTPKKERGERGKGKQTGPRHKQIRTEWATRQYPNYEALRQGLLAKGLEVSVRTIIRALNPK
jgi:hypothetical protein